MGILLDTVSYIKAHIPVFNYSRLYTRHGILSAVLSTFCTKYMRILTTQYILEVQNTFIFNIILTLPTGTEVEFTWYIVLKHRYLRSAHQV